MVVTDDERRAAARKLRGYVDMPDGWWQETLPQFYIEKCIFGDLTRHGEDELFARLADLIEPSEGQNGPDASVDSGCGTRVDRDALLALADNLDSSASMLLKQNDLDPNRKRRGIRRDHAQGLMAASGRIREALGVSCDA